MMVIKNLKKFIQKGLFVFTLLFLSASAIADNGWTNVGNPGFSANAAYYTNLAVDDRYGMPYVAYSADYEYGGKGMVMVFENGSWNIVGNSPASDYVATSMSVAIDSNTSIPTPYVAYVSKNANKVAVKRFIDNSWALVGTEFTADALNDISLAINRDSISYVAYVDLANGSRASVMRFDGNSWVPVGKLGFSSTVSLTRVNLAIASNGDPYISYIDSANGNRVTVMKFNGSSWVVVGRSGFSAGIATYVSLAIDDNNGINTPYVAYQDWVNGKKVTVMKFDGNNWVVVGKPGFSAGVADYISLAINKFFNHMPYVAYRDGGNQYKTTVMAFNSESWYNSAAGISAGKASYTNLAIDVDGIPYVIYQDAANQNKATVMEQNFIGITTSPSPVSIVQGHNFTITAVASGGVTDTINFSNANSNDNNNISYTPASCTVSIANRCTVTVNVKDTTPSGTYAANITANGNTYLTSSNISFAVTFAGFSSPTAISLDYTNTLFITNYLSSIVTQCSIESDGQLTHCSNSGATGIAGPNDIVLDPLAFTLQSSFVPVASTAYIASSGTGKIVRCNIERIGQLDNCVDSGATGLNNPISIALNSARRLLFIGEVNVTPIQECSISNRQLNNCMDSGATGIFFPTSIVLNPVAPYAFIADSVDSGSIKVCSVNGGTLSNCKDSGSGVSYPYGLALNHDASVLYVTKTGNPGNSIMQCNVNGGTLSNCKNSGVSSQLLNTPAGIVINPTNTFAFIANSGNNSITKCSINGTTLSQCSKTGS